MNIFTLYTVNSGSWTQTMISWLTKRTSSNMVIMPLPTGSLIEYFHRFVCIIQYFLLFDVSGQTKLLLWSGTEYFLTKGFALFVFLLWFHTRPHGSLVARLRGRWVTKILFTSYYQRKISQLSLASSIGKMLLYLVTLHLVMFINF